MSGYETLGVRATVSAIATSDGSAALIATPVAARPMTAPATPSATPATEGGPLVLRKLCNPPLPTKQAQKRRLRLSRQRQSAKWLLGHWLAEISPYDTWTQAKSDGFQHDCANAPAAARCRWTMGAQVTAHGYADSDRGSHLGGLQRCHSLSGCPFCSAVIRWRREQELDSAAQQWSSAGGQLLWVTLTLRHHADQSLRSNLDALGAAYRSSINGAPWKRKKVEMDMLGYVKSIEITHGQNGWHPHIHAVFFVGGHVTEQYVNTLRDWLAPRWAEHVVRNGALMPSDERGVDIKLVKSAEVADVAAYMMKTQDDKNSDTTPEPLQAEGTGWSLGRELMRFDLKDGRGGSREPFEFLDNKEPGDFARWIEYFYATKGKHLIQWSRGLKKYFNIEDKTDEEIAEELDDFDEEEVEEGKVLFGIDNTVYRQRLMDRADVTATVLDLIDAGQVEAAKTLAGGHDMT